MYKERMFEDWGNGLLYFIIVAALPVIPVIIYRFLENGACNAYLYVLILAVAATFFYEYMTSHKSCINFLRNEIFAGSIALSVALLVDVIFLFMGLTGENGATRLANAHADTVSILLIGLLCVPGVISLIETVRAFHYGRKAGGFSPDDKNNIVRGAEGV